MSDDQTIDTQALNELMRRPLDDPSLLDASAWRETVLAVTRPLLERVRQEFARKRPGQAEFSFSDRSDIKSRRQNYDSMFAIEDSGSPKVAVSIGLDDRTDEHTHHLFAGLYLWGRKDHIEEVHSNLKRQGVLRPDDEIYQKSGKAFSGTSLCAGLFLSPEEVSQAEPDELVDQIVDTLVEWGDRLAESNERQPSNSEEVAQPREEVAPSTPIIDRLESFMLARGFFFPRDLLASYYLALQSKPFVVLSGISGTGKTKLAQLFSEFMNPEPMSRAFVPVRPDWTDPRGLIGFHHLLTGMYHSTGFLELLL
ncbi:MAG: hypothetical protein MAG451_01813 [Anaerolineales bacterium]|nr:hypothetical protein [Anaerolineales bacterium]